MKKRAISMFVALMLMVMAVGTALAVDTSASANQPDFDVSEKTRPMQIEKYIDSETFGGLYYDDDTLVVNIVQGTTLPKDVLNKTTDGSSIVIKYVPYSLSDLENIKENLTPYMENYGIILLDANEVTNQVDIGLSTYNTEIIADIKQLAKTLDANITDVNILNFIDYSNCEMTCSVGTVDLEDLSKKTEGTARLSYTAGTRIIIDHETYTLGPILTSTTAFTAGHGFSGQKSITTSTGETIGTATSYYSSSGDYAKIKMGLGNFVAPNNSFKDGVVGTRIRMIGASSGVTFGEILRVNITISPSNSTVGPISGISEGSYRSTFGDSGAAVLSEQGTVAYGVHNSTLFINNVGAKGYFTPSSSLGVVID